MKQKRFLVSVLVLIIVMSCFGSISAIASTTSNELNEAYEAVNPEADIPVVEADALTLTNGTINNVICTGMTKSEVYDREKGRNVMKLSFNPKTEGTQKANAEDVAASLGGFSALLKDGVANTISFDYKIIGSSTGNVGIFLSDTICYDTGKDRVGLLLGNSGGMSVQPRSVSNRVTGSENWNCYPTVHGKWGRQLDSDNRQWNRITFAVDNTGKKVTEAYLNGEQGTTANGTSMNPIAKQWNALDTEIDALLFNTAGEVTDTSDLAVLIDNIRVYEGAPQLADTSAITSALILENDTSNPTELGNMTDGYVMDPVKGAVRKITFNQKGADKNVRSGLTGFRQYMTDETVNTISFDYKFGGSSKNNVGFFLNDAVGDKYWGQYVGAAVFGNKDGIAIIGDRANQNSGDWDEVATWWKHGIPN